MDQPSPLHRAVHSLPQLATDILPPFAGQAAALVEALPAAGLEHVYLTGCGDSYHAALNAALAFRQLAGLPCQALPAMEFSRYHAPYLAGPRAGSNLVLGISVSGAVSRTIEAVALAGQAGATIVAVTGNPNSGLATTTPLRLLTRVPPPAGTEPTAAVLPGTRSYVASQLALYLCAIELGRRRGHLPAQRANDLRRSLDGVAENMERTIDRNDGVTRELAAWPDAGHFVFCGAGPNYGSALFSAAKVLEASGEPALGQDLEEWAHLQYFASERETPTFILGAGGDDEDRALEVAEAAHTIGRRVVIVAPAGSRLGQSRHRQRLLPLVDPIAECFSPLVTTLPPMLFAAARAQESGEPYFRGFGGGRSAQGGGGISRIRTSHRLRRLPPEGRPD